MKQLSRIFKPSHFLFAWILFVTLSACTASDSSNLNEMAPEDSATVAAPEVNPAKDGPTTQNTEVVKTPDCTPESQDPMCRPVLVGGEGDPIVIGTAEIRGSFKIEYYPHGKIAKQLSFDPAHPEKPRRAKTLTYNEEGQIETMTLEEDDNLLDSVLDNVETRTLFYSDGKLQAESGTKRKPSQPNLPVLITQKKYEEMTANTPVSVYIEADLNHQQAREETYQMSGNVWDYEMVKRSQWDVALQAFVLKTGEARIRKWDATTNSKLEMYAYCDSSLGLNSVCDPQAQNFTKQYIVKTYYQHQGKTLTTAITGIDGIKHDLQNHMADETNDRNIACTINYDETNQLEPYPLPEEVKALGLSGKEVVKSIECTEGQIQSVFNFHYEPLWKVVGTK